MAGPQRRQPAPNAPGGLDVDQILFAGQGWHVVGVVAHHPPGRNASIAAAALFLLLHVRRPSQHQQVARLQKADGRNAVAVVRREVERMVLTEPLGRGHQKAAQVASEVDSDQLVRPGVTVEMSKKIN